MFTTATMATGHALIGSTGMMSGAAIELGGAGILLLAATAVVVAGFCAIGVGLARQLEVPSVRGIHGTRAPQPDTAPLAA